ncbi:MAG TPA: hypothetical protein ENH57_01540 [Actinobacteria bacterium]|nr:hypothetical protein [Actinomycetota bacterium]
MFGIPTADIIDKEKTRTMKYKRVVVITLIVTLASLAFITSGCVTEKPTQKILNKSLERFKLLTKDNEIFHEQYKLTFNDAFMDHTKDVYEDDSGTVKIESPTFELIRTTEDDEYHFFGHNSKNEYFDSFDVKKDVFEHHGKEETAATLLNSYISRGITMYTAHGPKSFWNKLLRKLLADSTVTMKTNVSDYEFTKKLDDESKVKLLIDRKSLLPTKVIVWTNAKKQHHGSQPYSKVTLNVIKRDTRTLQKKNEIFDMTIPKIYKLRKLVIKKHEHEHNMEEMGCTNCHTDDININRYEKNKFTLF